MSYFLYFSIKEWVITVTLLVVGIYATLHSPEYGWVIAATNGVIISEMRDYVQRCVSYSSYINNLSKQSVIMLSNYARFVETKVKDKYEDSDFDIIPITEEYMCETIEQHLRTPDENVRSTGEDN